MIADLEESLTSIEGTLHHDDVKQAREVALTTLVSPILYMASLVSAAILLVSDVGQSSKLYSFWLIAHCLLCSAFFLLSLREKNELFEGERAISSLVRRFSFISLGVAWGVIPGLIAWLEPAAPHFVFGAILSGTTLAATLLLQYMPQTGRTLLTASVCGFVGNIAVQPDGLTAAISLIMLAYFAGLAISSRWYFKRVSMRLQEVESVVERTKEINSVLRDVGFATDTCFWRIDANGIILEVGNDELVGAQSAEALKGRDLISLFKASSERDLLRSRIARGSEIVALELELNEALGVQSRFWKLSARPVFHDGEFAGYRGSATDITQLRLSEKRAAFLAEYDSVTGFMNRRSFTEALQRHLESNQSDTAHSALILIDLDNFKWINDTFGHGGGDDVLKLVAERISKIAQPLDILCRYGGDEFAILFTRSGVEGRLTAFVEELAEVLQKPYSYSDTDVQCGASLGLRRIDLDALDAISLLKEADLAVFAAKTTGRGVWKEYSESFKAQVRSQRELAQDLIKAIEDDTLNLQFQPIIDARTGTVSGVEALSRWHHPVRGAVSPSEFIPVAEDNGMIIALGDRVVQNAIQAALEFPASVRVAINISPLQLHSSRLPSLIEQQLNDTGIAPERVELEITESVFLSDNAFILERLHKLKELGLKIALDDFGTGFSSLAYLQRFPFDKLKLDQAFVRGIEFSDQSCAIARATISMAHALGLLVTAEGVESEAQAKFLKEQGCDQLQGYLYSRPQSQASLVPYLRSMELLHDAQTGTGPNVVPLKR